MGHERDITKFDDEEKDYRRIASNQLYEEGKIGFCGTTEDLRKREGEINKRAQEIKERELYEELKKKYG
jgi:hypothetical protein